MRKIWFEYWGGFIDVKTVASVEDIPNDGRYLCSDLVGDSVISYYDVNEDYIVAVKM